jgi:hypothetical protein
MSTAKNDEPAADTSRPTPVRDVLALSWRITAPYVGKHLVYSEAEQRVIGVGDTVDEAFAQAQASGVNGEWHYTYVDPADV